ncbi:MAG: TraR/DksA C4-type zinc finger protein [Methyloceanibacter sp.]|jgi:DksA/TraR C4-type zinc finger protein
MDNTEIERRSCRFCGVEIPQARLKALPDTRICVKCSESKGSEFELEVTTNSTGKAGSLKRTGQDVDVRRKPKQLK